MNTTNETMPAALRQLLVEAAAALENMSDFPYVTEENDDAKDAVRLAGRLRDAAAGRPLERTFDVRVTATLTLKIPSDIDPATAEGAERLKAIIIVEGQADEVARHIDWGAFDIEASEVEE